MNIMNQNFIRNEQITKALQASWEKIAPCWPIYNMVAVNPLKGFEDIHFEQALNMARFYFQKESIPYQLKEVNIQTIKWLQLFFDEGQATIEMPSKEQGIFKAIYELIEFDSAIVNKNNKNFYTKIKSNNIQNSLEIIEECLNYLNISEINYDKFLTILLTTLPGWASYIQYKNSEEINSSENNNIKTEYIALRLVFICLLYSTGKELLHDYDDSKISNQENVSLLNDIKSFEKTYQEKLYKDINQSLSLINEKKTQPNNTTKAQLIFCIDVRSEGFRKTIESLGNYETYGFAGFFGLPIAINDQELNITYQSCPVLLSPEYSVSIKLKSNLNTISRYIRKSLIKIYQSLKYNICTSFALAESFGGIAGLILILKTCIPKLFFKINTAINPNKSILDQVINIEDIPTEKQYLYGLNMLKSIGLIKNFSELIVLIGHASQTENNAYDSALDCGACAGRPGDINPFILASILNKNEVRKYLKQHEIIIPDTSFFVSGEHITTTDTVHIFNQNISESIQKNISLLEKDLDQAQKIYSQIRSKKLDLYNKPIDVYEKSQNWSETRPEWGLAQNASFIIGPRNITQYSDLDGRSFLHSYDWKIDEDGRILTTILNGPMIVGQWINAQYLFSTIDNVAFGAGSKITHNITGKIGVMQGNGSDLMNGLPMQSVYLTDTQPYHQPIRLSVLVYAPKELLDQILSSQDHLQKLIKNEWIFITCINPYDQKLYMLNKDLIWIL